MQFVSSSPPTSKAVRHGVTMPSPPKDPPFELERYTVKFAPNASGEDVDLVERLVEREGGAVEYYQPQCDGMDVLLTRRAVVYLTVNPAVLSVDKT